MFESIRIMPLTAIAVAIFINALWGGNPIAVKIGLEAFPPFWSAFLRFLIGSICIGAWALLTNKTLLPQRNEWPTLLWLSALFGVQIAAMNIGIDRSSGATSAVLISMYPLFAAALSQFYVKEDKPTLGRTVGLAIAFLGAVLIVLRGGVGTEAVGIGIGELIVLTSSALLGWRIVYTAGLLRRMEATRVVFWQMLLSLPAFLGLAVATETVVWSEATWPPVLGLLYQGIVIAGFGFFVNALLYRRYDPSVIAGFGFVSPATGVLLGIWLLDDVLTPQLIAGTVAVGCGLVLITRRRS